MPFASAQRAQRCRVDAPAVVGDGDHDVIAALEGLDADASLGILAARDALLARLDRVIERVADHVHQRIDELLDDQLVELGVGAAQLEPHVLAEVDAQAAHDARDLLEDLRERDHAHVEHGRLELAQLAVERLVHLREVAADARRRRVGAEPRHQLADRAALDHELADQVHQLVELVDVDAHRVADRLERLGLAVSPPSRWAPAASSSASRGRRSARARRGARGAAAALGAPARTRRTAPAGRPSRLATSPAGASDATSSEKRICASGASPGAGSVESTSPTSRIAVVSCDSPSSNEMISNVESIRQMCRPRRMFSRRRCSSYSVSARSSEGSSASSPNSDFAGRRFARRLDALREPADRLGGGGERVLVADLLEQAREQVHRFVDQRHHRQRERDAAEAQAVEDVLHAVREILDRIEAEQPGQALERVRRAEQAVHDVGIDVLAGDPLLVQVGEVLAHAVEDLLGLGDELLVRLAARTALAGSLGHGALPAPPGAVEQILGDLPQRLRGEGLDQVRVGAETQTLVAIALGALGRDDHQRNRAEGGVVLDERHQLESVDVGHVDVGQDQVVGEFAAARAAPRSRSPPR